MKYKNGRDLLPQELLKEIQKYVGGGLIYIPQIENERKSWGEISGSRTEISIRNLEIKNRFKKGLTISELSKAYCLAFETIKKIVYSK